MRRALRMLGWVGLALVGLPLLAVVGVIAALNTDPGRALAERLAAQATGGQVALSGLAGRFPDRLRVGRVTVSDARGVWLTLEDTALDWSPARLLRREASVSLLSVARVAVARLPESGASSAQSSSSGGPVRLPVRVDVARLRVQRIELAPAVAGVPAALAAEGSAQLAALDDGQADLTLRRLDGAGSYHAAGRVSPADLSATLSADEPPQGLASALAGVPALGALALRADIAGPWQGAATHLALSAGPLRLTAAGRVDLDGRAADLDLTATAPAMAPRPDVAWQSVDIAAQVHGPFARPTLAGHVDIAGLRAAGAGVARLAARVDGDRGRLALDATATGVTLPGPQPALLQADPLALSATVQLDAPDRPVAFQLSHKLLALRGNATTGGDIAAKARLDLPDLAPFAALGGAEVQGHAAFDVAGGMAGASRQLTLEGTLGISGGMAPLPGLIGPDARLGLTAAMQGDTVTLSRLQVQGAAVTLAATGAKRGEALDLGWTLALPDLAVLSPTLQGNLTGQGHVDGPTDDFAARADIGGEVAASGVPRGPVHLSLAAAHLPAAPAGHMTAEGTLDEAPLALDLTAARPAQGPASLTIERADWKSAHAEGALTLAPGATLPEGRIALRMDRLDDLRRLIGQPLTGALTAGFEMAEDQGRRALIRLEARNAGLAGTASLGRATLNASVRDPDTDPDLDATLDVTGLQASGLGGAARLSAKGRPSALALALQANLDGVGGAPLAGRAAARLDAPGRSAAVSAVQLDWKGETLRLLAPVRVAFGEAVAVDRLRLGLGQAVLELAGRLSPTLDATASLRDVTPDLAKMLVPDLQAEGRLSADAKLSGNPARPSGTVSLTASGLRLRSGPASSLPPAALTASARLNGRTADLQARVSEARNEIALSGSAPLDPAAAMDLRARGQVDLGLLNPILSAGGRQVRGRMLLDAAVTGTAAAPRASGTLRLADAEVQDFAQGLHLTNLQAVIEGAGETLRLARFEAQAGGGTLGASGTLGLAGAMPVDLRLVAHNATPLASDRLTAALDMDLSLRGEVQGALALGGSVKVNRADIRIPDKLPAKVAVLEVRTRGEPPPPPPAPGPQIGLDVTLSAPGQVFVRGRGLFAELQGRIHVAGSATAPQPSGKFTLRRGEFNLAGRTLTFTTGEVGFDGSGRLDPTLNFVASSTNGSIIATLTVTGYASAPKIALSSTPPLPQDEVLAQLLFQQSVSSLSGLQLAEAAAALAQISGATGAFDPLNSVRQGLGLDRLSVGGSQTGAGGPTVEAGRYVAPGVYVGAKQSTSGTGTQATVQVDLLKGLKLETNVGTGGATNATGASATNDPNGTSVGLTYHFDY